MVFSPCPRPSRCVAGRDWERNRSRFGRQCFGRYFDRKAVRRRAPSSTSGPIFGNAKTPSTQRFSVCETAAEADLWQRKAQRQARQPLRFQRNRSRGSQKRLLYDCDGRFEEYPREDQSGQKSPLSPPSLVVRSTQAICGIQGSSARPPSAVRQPGLYFANLFPLPFSWNSLETPFLLLKLW